jgi:salicylate hydroxylase
MGLERSVVIVGAGIGGLTTALALARDGWKVDIYEQAHKLDPVGAGIQLAPNCSRILDDLGLLPRLADTAVETERLVVRSGRTGKVLGGMTHDPKRWGGPFLVIHRGDLQMALLDAVAETPGISLNLGRRLEDLQARPDHVKAVFSKYGEETEITTGLLIAADGIWSKARGHVGLSGPANFSGCVAWRTTVSADEVGEAALKPQTNLWLAPGGHVVHYPVRGRREVNIVAIMEDSWRERGWSEAGDVAWINRRFHDWHSELRELIGTAESWLRWSLFDRAPDWKWTRGPVTLLGDAAHPMVPFLAQGAAQAIEDAAALARHLRETDDFPAALLAYEQERIPRTANVQRRSRRQMRVYHASGPLALARDLAMAAVGTSGMAGRFDWLYGHKA